MAQPRLRVVGALDGLVKDYDKKEWDYRVAGQYDWNDNLMTYLQFATGFKGGGISPRPFVVDQATNFDPETLKNLEFGTKPICSTTCASTRRVLRASTRTSSCHMAVCTRLHAAIPLRPHCQRG